MSALTIIFRRCCRNNITTVSVAVSGKSPDAANDYTHCCPVSRQQHHQPVFVCVKTSRAPFHEQKRSNYNTAITRELPYSFVDALSQHYVGDDDNNNQDNEAADIATVNFEKARQQHQNYVTQLGPLVPTVISLPALEEFPDCSFVEDTVVAIGNRALLTNPGHVSRRGEVDSIRHVLEQQLGMEVIDMKERSSRSKSMEATCDGGDVLYTGRHLFVGLSHRTNKESLAIIEDVFPDVPLIPVASDTAQGKHVLHLKSAVTHLDEATLLAPSHPMGYKLLRAMRAEALGYTAIRLPNVLACNAVAVSSSSSSSVSLPAVMVQDVKCSTTRQLLQDAADKRNIQLVFVDTSELAKKDAALTCCSVLLSI